MKPKPIDLIPQLPNVYTGTQSLIIPKFSFKPNRMEYILNLDYISIH